MLSMVCSLSYAQPIDFIVSASPGGPNDTITRKLVEKLEKQTNLEFVILNKPGGAHTIAYNHVLNTNRPTLIISTPEIDNHEVIQHVDELYNAGHFTNILFVSQKSGIKNIKDLKTLSKTREINFGHGGVGSSSYFAMETMCEKTLRCLDVPYKSGIEGMLGVLTGTIDTFALASHGAKAFLENEKYVAIYNVKMGKDKTWIKLFSKNLSNKDKETIINVLKSQDSKFYVNMGLEK